MTNSHRALNRSFSMAFSPAIVLGLLPGYGQATATRLMASSFSSTTGVTLGRQTFDGSTDGRPQGSAYSEIATPVNGVYTIAIPSVSTALVTVRPEQE